MGFARFVFAIATASPLLLAQGASAFSGTWRGQSSCEQKESACRDEAVVYRVSPSQDKPGLFAVSADKIVDGKAINMGTLEFRYIDADRALVCENSQGVWRLSVDGAKMKGTLIRPDGTLFRRAALHKE